MSPFLARRDTEQCRNCGFCRKFLCRHDECIGCGACVVGCPFDAGACRHLVNHHPGRIFLGIGIPYSRDLISLEEVHRMGTEIASMDSELQVCLLDYRPEFGRRHIDGFGIWQPDCREMAEAADVLREAGLKMVIAQTIFGHIGP